jgi:thiamine biosynthesis lipoprotein
MHPYHMTPFIGPRIARRSLLTLPFLGVALAGRRETFQFHHENVLGTSMEMTVNAASEHEATMAEAAALAEIDRLAKVLSTYDPASEINLIQQFGGSRSRELASVLSAYHHWHSRTNGAISLTPGTKDWNVDALGKAYILESAKSAALRASPGVRGLLLNIGGDIVTAGNTPWRIAIANPSAPHDNAAAITDVVIGNQAIATSGISERGRHIVDPRNEGVSHAATGVTSATVIAPDAITANALSTALCVVQPEHGLQLIASTPGAHTLMIDEDGREFRSPGFSRHELPPRIKNVLAAGWPDGYEVSIQLTLKTVQMMRVRRPYVAIWAEDTNGKLVRNIEAWASKQKYLPDLNEWWKINGRSYDVSSVTKPTRDPGKYRLVWNGLDDRGRPLPPGTYQIFVETNREHGNYYKRNTSILCGPKPSSASLPETPEFETVSIAYGPRGSAA